MKKTTTIAALSVAALLSATPLLVSADNDYWDDDRYEDRYAHHGLWPCPQTLRPGREGVC